MAEKRSGNPFVIWWGLLVFGANLILNIVIQVPPEDAISNTARWISFLHLHPPKWLEARHADIIGLRVSYVLMLLGLVWFISPSIVLIYRRFKGDRVFVDASPDDIFKLVEGQMPLNAQKIVKPFIGKWMKVSGTLHTIIPSSSRFLVYFREGADRYTRRLIMVFGPMSRAKLEILTPGQQMTVIGRISEISGGELWLYRCEIISTESREHSPV